ncbi:MAG: LacI family DNA-binding transcriptional regulator [Chloroflexi bacterium]|nr:LacI family DNA-binding transcriptional regulator [Chloroflexota bacterium]
MGIPPDTRQSPPEPLPAALPSLAEVARRAAVSASTASRALNRPELVRPEVVSRVRRIAEELGYAANPFARWLRVQETKTLGLIVPDSSNPFFAEVARGVETAGFRAGYTLFLCNSERSLEKEAAQARALYEKRVDGVLFFITGDGSADTIRWLRDRALPVVLMERRSPIPEVDCVVSDNAGGVRAAVEHLAGLGHRRIGFLGGDTRAPHYAERLAAFRAVVQRLGLEAPDELVRPDLVTYADGKRAALELLAGDGAGVGTAVGTGTAAPGRRATALFCATDTLAIGAIGGATEAGLRVPEQVSIVGFGNTEVGAFINPPLTSVGQEKVEAGARAVRLLLRRLAQRRAGQPARPRVHVLPTRLVVRRSTAAAPATRLATNPAAPSSGMGVSRNKWSLA